MSLPTYQPSFEDLGTPLHQVDFVVVDLETTGGSAADCGITEIGAVRTRGGQVVGEFQTLVNPGVPVPPFIAALTGITNAALAGQPRIEAVLPGFLEFARGSVLVAHNAGFDTGFLKAACRTTNQEWPAFPVVDTARLARVLLHRDEVPNHKLATLARHFRSTTTPNHRALADARATVDVLHGLLERAAGFGVTSCADLQEVSGRVRPEQRQKRTLADGLPAAPGVYRFIGPTGETLYVGKSKSIRNRVRSYFTASETRARIIEMVRIAQRVEAIPCASELEANVREIRLIAEHKPPYNRRSRNPEKNAWLKLTREPFPRVTVVHGIGADARTGATYVGPYPARRAAEQARDALQLAFPLRTCTARLARSVRTAACIAADLGTCLAPCQDADAHAAYADLASRTATAMAVDVSPVVAALTQRMNELAAAEDYETAARERDRLRAFLAGARRAAEHHMLAENELVVAAAADGRDWVVHVIRYGRLAGAGRVLPGMDPGATVTAIVDAAEHVEPDPAGAPSALAEETSLILAWLWSPGVRLVRLAGTMATSITAPHRFTGLIDLRRPQLTGAEPTRRTPRTPTPNLVTRIDLR